MIFSMFRHCGAPPSREAASDTPEAYGLGACGPRFWVRDFRPRPATTRRVTSILLLLVIAVGLAGCGKKGPPRPPANEPDVYPRAYPSG